MENLLVKNKAALSDHVYKCAMTVIEDENYDLLDEFLPSDLANAVCNIFKNMIEPAEGGFIFRNTPVSIFTLGYQWKVSNNKPCYVSCSDESSTGVCRSVAPFILPGIYGLEPDDIKELLDMMNESWSHCKNKA